MTERTGWGPWVAIAVVVAAVVTRTLVLEPVRVLTASMAPSLLPGDVALVLKPGDVEAGDVVAIEEPGGEGARYLKRVVAVGGEEVELSAGRLYVDGAPLAVDETISVVWLDPDCGEHSGEARTETRGDRRWSVLLGGEQARVEVPEGHLWLLGDNRASSSDSRHWGAVPREAVLGRVWRVAWSRAPCGRIRWNRIGG